MLKLSSKQKLIVAIVAGVAALATMVALALALGQSEQGFALVYARGGQNLYLAVPQGTYLLAAQQSNRQVFTGGYFYFDSVDDDGLHLYVVQLNSAESRRVGGRRIAENIEENWSASGRHAVFVQVHGGRLFEYEADGQTRQLAERVQGFYAAPGRQIYFFTARQGEVMALFRGQMGETPARMTGDVENVRFFYSNEQVQVFYQSDFALYKLLQIGRPQRVADQFEDVLWEHYRAGGNLYFLVRGEVGDHLNITLEDPEQAADAAMREPTPPRPPGALQGIFGGIFGGIGEAGQAAYERNRAAWNAKLERDHVRQVAQQAMQSMPAQAEQMLLYVFDGMSTQRLAVGLSAEGIAALRAQGRPAAVFEKTQGPQSALTVTLAALQAHYSTDGAEGLHDYLHSLVQVQTLGWSLAMLTAQGASELDLGQGFGGRAGWQTHFMQNNETMVTMERDAGANFMLHAYDLLDYGLSARRFLAAQVSAFAIGSAGIYYRVQEVAGGRGLLYYYDGSSPQRVLANAEAFFFAGETLLALHDVADTAGAFSIITDGQVRLIARDVRIDSVNAGEYFMGFVANWSEGAGELWMSDFNGLASLIDVDVTEILAVN